METVTLKCRSCNTRQHLATPLSGKAKCLNCAGGLSGSDTAVASAKASKRVLPPPTKSPKASKKKARDPGMAKERRTGRADAEVEAVDAHQR